LLLIFYAFDRELAPLRRRVAAPRPLGLGDLRGFRGQMGAVEIAAVHTGIGLARARHSASRTFQLLPAPELVIATGVAGGLTEGLRAGDVILADRVIGETGGAVTTHAIDREHHRRTAHALRRAGLGYASGPLLSAREMLATPADKRAAKDSSGAIAVDMETAALAEESAARGLGFVSVRTVIDEVGDELAKVKLDPEGRVRGLATLRYLALNPRALLLLPRTMRNMGLANRSLGAALEAIARDLGAPAPDPGR